ncbi:MAG: polyprenyl synthetase family protein [Candidatus Ranarchaeia archaeon]|jgi:geranylgeranyl pyrophosphate synthase
MENQHPAFLPILTKKIEIISTELEKIFLGKEPQRNFYSAMKYALSSGGKRIRPALCLVVYEGFTGKWKEALPFALALEIIHNMTLVHDDIMDGDRTRRDQDSIWVKFGIAHGINIGDGMYSLALEQITKADYSPEMKEALFALANSTAMLIFEGQAMDVDLRDFDEVTEETYLQSVRQKTGVLIAAAVSGGAIIAKALSKEQEALRQYGINIGMAFQIRDDIIDLTEGKGRGGEIGCDIKEGKKSLITIHALMHANEAEKEKLLHILRQEREKTTQAEVDWVISLYKKLNSIEYAQTTSENLVRDSLKSIQILQEEGLRGILEDLAHFIIQRKA